jgi:hypothetical protein
MRLLRLPLFDAAQVRIRQRLAELHQPIDERHVKTDETEVTTQ